jgi:protein phosphatase/serine/threonine-protein phosphatase Stp1
MLYRSAASTHVGAVRQRNEDAVLERPEIGLWAVADGAGGHQRGDYASASIITALREISPARHADIIDDVRARLAEVNRRLREKAAAIGPNALVGSTAAVVLILDTESCCLWAGDSRLYRFRADHLEQMSRDQSHVQNLVDRGEIPPEAASNHPLGNLVTNLVGASDELVLEERRDRLQPGDKLLLCSDGLSGTISDFEIAAVLRETPVADAPGRLIDRALARGARDNVSAVVIECLD